MKPAYFSHHFPGRLAWLSPGHPVGLQMLTLAYLALPVILFVTGWLRPAIGFPLASLLLLAITSDIFATSKHGGHVGLEIGHVLPLNRVMLLLAVAICWVSLSGIGGIGVQTSDYSKHNAVLRDLSERRWPVTYLSFETADHEPRILVYYIGYYLPAAVVGGLLGWPSANAALFAWGVVGIWLTFCWFLILLRQRSLWFIFFFMIAGGMDHIGYFLVNNQFKSLTSHVEWWAHFCEFASNATHLCWAPQHAIAGWLLISVLLWRWENNFTATSSCFWLALGSLWSIFIPIGLLPFILARPWRTFQNEIRQWDRVVAAIALATVLFFYYSAQQGGILTGWIWTFHPFLSIPSRYLLFPWLEYGIFFLLAGMAPGRLYGNPRVRWVCLAILIFLPLYKVGLFSDMAMRSSIPALYVLWLLIAHALAHGWENNRVSLRYKWLLVSIVLAAPTGLGEALRSAEARFPHSPPPLDNTTAVSKLPSWYGNQYLGNVNSYFYRQLARLDPLSAGD